MGTIHATGMAPFSVWKALRTPATIAEIVSLDHNTNAAAYCIQSNWSTNTVVQTDPCNSSPCVNSGVCISVGPFDYTCQCAVGYTGSSCEANIDDCVSAICPNNSMCVDGVNSYKCVCYPNLELNAEGRCVSASMGNQGK